MIYDADKLLTLYDAVVSGRDTPEEYKEFEGIVASDDEALELYLDYSLTHAALALANQESSGVPFPQSVPATKLVTGSHWNSRALLAASLICPLALCIGIFGMFYFTGKEETQFASIIRSTNSLWADSKTHTSVGTRLGVSRLRLEQGIVLIRFDCDVEISLEGPADLEIKGKKHIILHAGRLVTSVESSEGHGFLVATPDAVIKDLGTKFCVSTIPDASSTVHVIEGSVEVFPKNASESFLLKAGTSTSLKLPLKPDLTEQANFPLSSVLQIGSAVGRGKEAWVVRGDHIPMEARKAFPNGDDKSYMLVKTSLEPNADRKAFFCIDLDILKQKSYPPIQEVTLVLSFGPTEIGYASLIADAEFILYGLVDETQDDWAPNLIDWNTFPSSEEDKFLAPVHWKQIGRFTINQGIRTGTVRINNGILKSFIEQDTNGLVTFAVVRDTYSRDMRGLVHGFANRFHKTLMPPQLIFHFDDKPERNGTVQH